MKDRIKAARASTNMNQADFGKAIGVTLSAVQKWELGLATPRPSVIKIIASQFGINEEWLRTGEGEMKAEGNRAAEVQAQVERLFSDDTAEFQQALISSLLAFDPHGPQWRVVEEIFENVTARLSHAPPGDSPSEEDLHQMLSDQLASEGGEESQVS